MPEGQYMISGLSDKPAWVSSNCTRTFASRRLVPCPPKTAAIVAGTVDGGIMSLPNTLQAEANGHHPLINMAEAKLPAAIGTIYVQRSYASSHKDIVQKYMDSLVQATARLKKDRAFTLNVYKKYVLDDERALNAIYDFYS